MLSLSFNWAPCHEGMLGSGGLAPPIIDLGTRWRWVVSFTTRPLYPQGKSPFYYYCPRGTALCDAET
jgi:hypothetical protein